LGKPLAHTAVALALAQMGQDATVHGFRSAFCDWAGETAAFPHDICEAAIAEFCTGAARKGERRSRANACDDQGTQWQIVNRRIKKTSRR
jgi:hypothetical protein